MANLTSDRPLLDALAANGNGARPTDEELFADAIEADRKGDEGELGVSPFRWRQADAYAELRKRGYTQEVIAKKCGVSQQTVSVYIRASTRNLVKDQRPPFRTAYAEVTREKLSPKRQAKGGTFNFGGDIGWAIPPKVRKRAAKAMLAAVTRFVRSLADDPDLWRHSRHDVAVTREMLDKVWRDHG